MSQIKAVLVGAGSRGVLTYGGFAKRYPQRLKFVAVADPNDEHRRIFSEEHNIPSEMQFRDWQELFDKPILGDILINATTDRLHVPVTIAALEKGYDVLQEKPIASTLEDCLRLLKASRESDKILQICHCLRYTPYYMTAYEIIDSGKIGSTITIDYQENVTFDHMAHSFVRGNYRNVKGSSPMLIAKACHDLDILVWFANGRKPVKVSSFGALTYFRSENAPDGAPERCTDGCRYEHICPYSAIKMYIKELGPDIGYGGGQWQVSPSTDPKVRWQALAEGPYGRCVFRCDNDVVDHQVVNIEFEGDLTVAFTMQGFGASWPKHPSELYGAITGGVGRTFTVFGTKGVMHSPVYGHIETSDFLIKHTEKIHTGYPEGSHGGGDFGLIHSFLDMVESKGDSKQARVSVEEAITSHIIGFAAEESRLSGRIVEIEDFVKSVGDK